LGQSSKDKERSAKVKKLTTKPWGVRQSSWKQVEFDSLQTFIDKAWAATEEVKKVAPNADLEVPEQLLSARKRNINLSAQKSNKKSAKKEVVEPETDESL